MNGLRYSSLILSLCFGCSAVADAGRPQCTTDTDCTARGADFANTTCVANYCEATDAWSCAKHPMLMTKAGKSYGVSFALFDAVSMKMIPDIKADLCGKLDLVCSSPASTLKTADDGVVRFDVPSTFDGYVQLTGDGYDATMMFLPPTVADIDLGTFPLTTMLATSVLGSQLGKPLIPGTGRVLTTITGCDMQTAEGVSLSGENMGAAAAGFYSISGFPSFSAVSTDSSGFAGFVNVAPGSITLNAELESGRQIGRVAIFVRPDYVSVRRIQPWTD
jgi:hypothetical protein